MRLLLRSCTSTAPSTIEDALVSGRLPPAMNLRIRTGPSDQGPSSQWTLVLGRAMETRPFGHSSYTQKRPLGPLLVRKLDLAGLEDLARLYAGGADRSE